MPTFTAISSPKDLKCGITLKDIRRTLSDANRIFQAEKQRAEG
jgi:hypothetical protein